MKRLLQLLLAAAILLTISPEWATAASEGSVAGHFGIAVAPELEAIEIFEAGTSDVPHALSPRQEYDIKVTVTDFDGIDNLNVLTVRMWYDFQGDQDNEAGFDYWLDTPYARVELIWSRETNSVSLTPMPNSTWEIVQEHCVLPSLAELDSETTFTFTFRVGVSRVAHSTATEIAFWRVGAKVQDEGDQADFLLYENGGIAGIKMNWYGEIAVDDGALVDWGNIPAGTNFSDSHSHQRIEYYVRYYANGNYSQQIKAGQVWTMVDGEEAATLTNDASSPNSFALMAGARQNIPGQTLPDVNSAIPVPADGSFVTICSSDFTGELGDAMSPSWYFYGKGWNDLFIKVSHEFITGTYTGTLTYGVVND